MPTKKKPDFRKIFSLAAVEKRFKTIGRKPVRADYGAAKDGPVAFLPLPGRTSTTACCLLGSFEHMVFGESSQGVGIAEKSGLSEAVIRYLEAGWEEWDVDLCSAGSDITAEEAAAYEWGLALGRMLVDGAL